MKNPIANTVSLLVIFTLVISLGLAKDATDLEAKLHMIMNQTRIKKPFDGISDEQLRTTDPQRVLLILGRYENDSVWTVRQLAYLYEVRLAKLQPMPEIRQEVAKRLVKALVEPSSNVSSHSYKWLLSFTEKDFNNDARAMIRQALAKDKPKAKIVRICGVANIHEELPRLKNLLIDEMKYQAKADKTHNKKWYLTVGWAARLARARMGVKEDIQKCIALAEAEPDSDERVLRILPQIGYIRQPAAIEYLREYLESNKRLPRVKSTVPGQLYANWVMHILAESLINYPVKKKEARNYTREESDLCRKWMSERKWVIIR